MGTDETSGAEPGGPPEPETPSAQARTVEALRAALSARGIAVTERRFRENVRLDGSNAEHLLISPYGRVVEADRSALTQEVLAELGIKPGATPSAAAEANPQLTTLEVLRRFLVDQGVQFSEGDPSSPLPQPGQSEGPPGERFAVTPTGALLPRSGQLEGPSGEIFVVRPNGALVIRGTPSELSRSVQAAGLVAEGKPVTVLAVTGRWAPGERHVPLGISLLFRLGILWAFSLPFVSVSCLGEHTEPLTGYEAARGVEPEWLPNEYGTTDEGDRDEVRSVLRQVEPFARVALAVTAISAVLSASLFALRRPTPGSLWLVVLGVVSVLMVVMLGTMPGDSGIFPTAATVHHHDGFAFAVLFTFLGLLSDVWAAKASLGEAGEDDPLTARTLGCGAVVLVGVVILLVGMAAFG